MPGAANLMRDNFLEGRLVVCHAYNLPIIQFDLGKE